MAIRNIFTEGEPVLRKRAKEVTVFDERLHTLLDDMKETLGTADGVGLAAPQVGVMKRAFILDFEGEYLEAVNPVLSDMEGGVVASEGCLSVDSKKNCRVLRPEKLTLKAFDRFGKPFSLKAEGWKARIICHETDHLDGILFIDKKYEGKPEGPSQL